jgi:quercetin dioxygenase-like cupin family protein
MRVRLILAIASSAMVLGVGGAVATHVPEVPPGTVPAGFLETHNDVERFNLKSFKRAVRHRQADVFVQHIVLGPNGSTPWHTHPGPVIVTVAEGAFNYQFAEHKKRHQRCVTIEYESGEGFVDPGFGHVHRGFAGAAGAHVYATYVMPTGATHIIPRDPPAACS